MRIFLFFILTAVSCFAASVELKLGLPAQKAAAGSEFEAVAVFSIPQGTYIYAKDPGQAGLATKLGWQLPAGFELVGENWQTPEEKTEEGLKVHVYQKEAKISAKIRAPKDFRSPQKIGLDASWLACSELCVPQSAQVSAQIEPLQPAPAPSQARHVLFEILGAFLGGMILNLMPCVFPVIGLKILSFAKDAGKSRAQALINAAFYSAGIVASFCALALALVWIRAAGGAAGWGFQLQEPKFVAFLIMLFFALGLSFAGVFEIGAGLSSAGGAAAKKSGKAGALFSGVLAVVVASPCTAPFMGSALGFALASNASVFSTLAIFISLGLGMAFPYVLLSALPQLSKYMPRPGAWLETFKQFLAFPLFAAAIWLLSVFIKERGAAALPQILFAALLLAFALWLFGKYSPPANSKPKRIFAFASLAVLGAISALMAYKSASAEAETPQIQSANSWSESRVEALRKEGKIVYVDFTASWCLTCLANKKAVLETEKIREFFRQNNVVLLTADWTGRDPEITKYLKKFGRSGVPLNMVFSPDLSRPPAILPEILTQKAVMDAVDKAKF
ncbi:MAG: thioredoxin family protein [Opitutales bacterium]|nr:thioredoxin family protein [Opitutales bacterium]